MPNKCTSDYLSVRTQPGVFRDAEGIHHWVFDSSYGRVAVQLEPSALRPSFAYLKLDNIPMGVGEWLGPVDMVTEQLGWPAHRGRAGIYVRYRDRAFLKVCEPGGSSSRLMFTFKKRKWIRGNWHCAEWRLILMTSQRRTIFSMTEPTFLGEYQGRSGPDFDEPNRCKLK